ncbi:MAG: hypothetical protein AAGK78_13510, partial [Planctomycetota bacterium]
VARNRGDELWTSFRAWALGSGPLEWLMVVGGAAGLTYVLWNLGWLPWWIGGGLLAWGAAAAYLATIEKNVRGDRQPMVARAERVLRDMRTDGVEERVIRRAVADAAMPNWEPFYEALFGHPEKPEARRAFGRDDRGNQLPRPGGWRDRAIAWFNLRLEKRRLRADQELLQDLHASALIADGIKAEVARKQGLAVANREIGKAVVSREQAQAEMRRDLFRPPTEAGDDAEAKSDEQRQEESGSGVGTGSGGGRGDDKPRRKDVQYTDDEFERIRESYFKRRFGTPLDLVLGQPVRFVLGVVLLICFAAWFNQNQNNILITGGAAQERAEAATEDSLAEASEAGAELTAGDSATSRTTPSLDATWVGGETEPLQIAGVDDNVTQWVSGWRTGLAGMMLVLSALF